MAKDQEVKVVTGVETLDLANARDDVIACTSRAVYVLVAQLCGNKFRGCLDDLSQAMKNFDKARPAPERLDPVYQCTACGKLIIPPVCEHCA